MNILYEGTLQQNEETFKVAPLSLDHIHQILFLQDVVIEALENKDSLQPLTLEEYQYILNGNGLMIGAFVDEQLIAFRGLLVPPIDDDHLGFDIGLKAEELERVIYQEISNVHPAYRGNGIQKTLANLIMEQLKQSDNKYDYVCCTVAPFNIPSLKDKFAQGMEVAALKEKYSDRIRYIFVKELQGDDKKDWTSIEVLRMSDIVGQQRLLAEGYRGYEMEERDGEYWVRFGK
ncbi:GNAT family N-acetyltransferase [Bacillus sp. DX1.1]|uniref:GNAT family N-acetyltransferase n=1 Tax=unclassified Bacillus (in: firmicutes) TaxID=185979 RepID=UPI002570C530|nr:MULTISPECIES: GNAT family N-acetyltransferase [unclassified Bacillus (in: firmicutes)]MDM5153172.1 GNAT family N-acetyltransferase [Bacillus sp. DX1.1]WJE82140.1 GNAT family N-acetyltransferase [Bacillus sp. DX3.1]